MRGDGRAACLALLLCAWTAAARADGGEGRYLPLDPARSVLGFELTTRFGQKLEGRFVRFDGGVRVLEDGRHQVTLRMFADSVEITGHPHYSQWARGRAFFDAGRWPQLTFVSQPYDPAMLREGGEVTGDLTIRGIRHPYALQVRPAPCARPAIDCAVVSTGAIQRSEFGMDNWQLAVDDQVVFTISARLLPPQAQP
ncbi:MAG: YceI family protein [Pseudoxanthomonas sp.]